VAANSTTGLFAGDGGCVDAGLAGNLDVLAGQVMQFVRNARPEETAAP